MFVELIHKQLPELRVVLNVGDVQQGTGSGSRLEDYQKVLQMLLWLQGKTFIFCITKILC
jgi:hypothetical protein